MQYMQQWMPMLQRRLNIEPLMEQCITQKCEGLKVKVEFIKRKQQLKAKVQVDTAEQYMAQRFVPMMDFQAIEDANNCVQTCSKPAKLFQQTIKHNLNDVTGTFKQCVSKCG